MPSTDDVFLVRHSKIRRKTDELVDSWGFIKFLFSDHVVAR